LVALTVLCAVGVQVSVRVFAPVALLDDIYLLVTLLVESLGVHISLGDHLRELRLGLGLALLDLLAVRCSPLTAAVRHHSG